MDSKKLIENFAIKAIGGAEDEPVLKPYGGGSRNEGQFLMSREVFDIIDLIGEGPIYGLVDANGARVQGNRNLCGVYLDDTPVRVTRKKDVDRWTNEVKWKIENTGSNSPSASNPDAVVSELSAFDDDLNALTDDGTLSEEEYNQIYGVYNNNETLKSFFRALKGEGVKTRDPFQFYKTPDIKFAFVPYNQIDFSAVKVGSTDYSVYYSGANGTGELWKRYARRGNPNSTYFEQSTVVEIPEPIMNLSTRVSRYEKEYTHINGGYIIIPLASGDGLEINNGQVRFSQVDGNCLDPISNQLNGAYLFLKARNDDLTNSFNFEQFNLSINYGYENQNVLPNFSDTIRSYESPMALYGPITDYSFVDNTDPRSFSGMSPSKISAAYEPNEYRFDALTPTDITTFYGKAATSTKTLSSSYNYAGWALASLRETIGSDEAVFTHNVENDSVVAVSVVFTINGLNDTLVHDDEAGEPVPTTAALRIEVGIDGDSDPDDELYEMLIAEKTVFDIGIEGLVIGAPFRFTVGDMSTRTDNWIAVTTRTKKGSQTESTGGPSMLLLPPPIAGRSRYVRVYRLTPETFSSKKNIDFSLNTINEHYAYAFSYPLSAIAGVSIDARSFARIPTRTYDLRLKKVMVPSNYYPLDSQGMDRREIKYAYKYNNDALLYNGDWDGTFRRDWTDNPAWVLYDLLTDPIYGVGNSIDDFRDIDIWTLYQIGRYCDAVDDNGYYIGIPDGYGGLEPRFSCNIMLQNERDAYDILNSIATIFRGLVFYGGNSMNFSFDYPQESMGIFGNHNVKDGVFQYSDSLKSSRFTVVEVPYIDKRNAFLQKIESAEDERAIQKYGYIKKTFEGFGITSRGQAQRLAKYALYSNNLETESVSFTTSREGFYVHPSDVIRIDDELKSLDVANGNIIHIDYDNKTLTANWLPTGGFTTGIILYTPTGRGSIQELFDKVYEQDLDVTMEDIYKLKSPQTQIFQVDSYETTTSSIGNVVVGSGIKINLNTGQNGIEYLNEVKINSMFSVPLTGRDANLYRIIGMSYTETDEINISAVEYEPRKFALIESGIRFEKDDSFWSDRQLNMMINSPDAPLGVSLYTGISDGGIDFTGSITGSTSGIIASSFYCKLTSPAGYVYDEIVANNSNPKEVYFNNLGELGTYTLAVQAIGPAPNKLKSTVVATTLTATEDNAYIYSDIGITGFSLANGLGKFNVAQETGDYTSFTKDLVLDWQLKDRMGTVISHSENYKTKNITVSLDVLDENDNEISLGILNNVQQNNFLMPAEDIEGIFGGSYPRNFKFVLNTTGQNGNDNSGILYIHNYPPTIQSMGVLDYYDGIANSIIFNIKGDINALRDSDSVIFLTGASGEFQGTGTANQLLYKSFDSNIIPKEKRIALFRGAEYPTFVLGTFIAERSLKDYYFVNGEQVFIESNGAYPDYIAANTPYELIRGDAINTSFSIDVENSNGTGTGVTIQCRSYDPLVPDEWRPLDYAGNNWSTHTTTGILSEDATNANAPQSITTGVYNYQTQRHGGFLFNGSGAIRIAGDYLASETITAITQSGLEDFTASVQFYPLSGYDGYEASTIRTLLDFSSESGGFYLAMLTGTTNAEKLISGDIKLAGDSPTSTGDTITLVGQTGYTWSDWNHVAINCGILTGDGWNSGIASLIINGKTSDTVIGSGSGIRFTYGPQAVGASAGILITGNGGRSSSTMDRPFIGYLNSINMYRSDSDLDEVQAMRYGKYSQYIFRLANTGTKYPITGMVDNVDDLLSVIANSGSILQFNLSNYNNLYEQTLVEKIETAGGYDGIQKLIYMSFDTASTDLEREIIGMYSLREEDYIAARTNNDKTLIWQHFEGKDIAIQYISGTEDPIYAAGYTGRWIIWSGDTSTSYGSAGDKIFYTISGSEYINTSDPSGYPPIGSSWPTGDDGEAYGLSGVRRPIATRRAGPAQKSSFKDLYVRAILVDDLGTGNIFPPLDQLALPISYASVQNESQTLLGYQAKILGDQSRSLTDYVFAAYTWSGTAFTDFDTFITEYIGPQSTDSYIPPEQPAVQVEKPIIYPTSPITYNDPLAITISYPTAGCTKYYKAWKDSQSEPSNWSTYTSSFNISWGPDRYAQWTVKAYATKAGFADSDVATKYYMYEWE